MVLWYNKSATDGKELSIRRYNASKIWVRYDNPWLKTWLILHQSYNLVLKAEDAVFAKAGLTTQKHAVLMAMKHIHGPVTPTNVGNWLDRNSNSISTLVDRMEKDGLVKRARDLRDHRSVRLVMTDKGKEILDEATVLGWQLIQNVLGGISEEELWTLTHLLERVRGSAFEYLNPDQPMEEIKIADEARNISRFMARIARHARQKLVPED